MIYCKELDKEFDTMEEMHLAIKQNVKKIIDAKKSVIKIADCYNMIAVSSNRKLAVKALKHIALKNLNPLNKAEDVMKDVEMPMLKVTSVANTTNWFDSHRDVHADGIWNKTLADNSLKGFKHLQEHKGGFEHVIDSKAVCFIENTTFKALGFNYEGTTQALKGVSTIDPNRNLFMYNQYANNWVDNHSVGMQYVSLVYCANSEVKGMEKEKANYDKYYSLIANKSEVDEYGYFFYVTEAKLCEYSAVVDGSNRITPTESVEIKAEAVKPLDSEDDEDEEKYHDDDEDDEEEADKTLLDQDIVPKRRFI